jgi:hypothetical protein
MMCNFRNLSSCIMMQMTIQKRRYLIRLERLVRIYGLSSQVKILIEGVVFRSQKI